jgi:hypothetical protein
MVFTIGQVSLSISTINEAGFATHLADALGTIITDTLMWRV